jgi:hypothetical protein
MIKTKKPSAGRPSKYTEALAEEIAERLSKGETFTSICRSEHMPTIRTVQIWAGQKPDFFALMVRAREAGSEFMVGDLHDKMIKLVVDSENPDKEALPPRERSEALKLYASHVQWMTARWNPRRYSERVLAEMAKLPEPKAPDTAPVDTQYLTYEERETFKQLLLLAKSRKEGMIDGEGIETNDGTDGTDAGTDDQSGDPTG